MHAMAAQHTQAMQHSAVALQQAEARRAASASPRRASPVATTRADEPLHGRGAGSLAGTVGERVSGGGRAADGVPSVAAKAGDGTVSRKRATASGTVGAGGWRLGLEMDSESGSGTRGR